MKSSSFRVYGRRFGVVFGVQKESEMGVGGVRGVRGVGTVEAFVAAVSQVAVEDRFDGRSEVLKLSLSEKNKFFNPSAISSWRRWV